MDDASYKRLLGHERIVKDLLIGFIAPRRPAGWAETLDFDSLSEGPTESINDELRRRHDDVVWSIDRRAACGAVHTLHVLIEHQSSVDYSMPLRFLNYTSLLYQRRYRGRTRWSREDTADPVLHVVVYNGDARWDAPLTLAGLVKRTEHDGPAQLALSYDVVDLMAVGTETGRDPALDSRVRGGKCGVGEHDRSLGSGNPAARYRAGYRAGEGVAAPTGGAAVRCGGGGAACGRSCRGDRPGPPRRSG
jgi:hypothetical protein